MRLADISGQHGNGRQAARRAKVAGDERVVRRRLLAARSKRSGRASCPSRRICSPPITARSTARRRCRCAPSLLGALAYFVLPFDVPFPIILPVLGFTDDAAVLAAAMKLVIDNIRPEHHDAARQKADG